MERYDVLYTRNNLSRLISRVESGEEIEISRRGHLVAKLVPATPPEPEYWSGKDIVAWLREHPIPKDRRKSTEEIDAWVAELRGDEE